VRIFGLIDPVFVLELILSTGSFHCLFCFSGIGLPALPKGKVLSSLATVHHNKKEQLYTLSGPALLLTGTLLPET
jgi:hypothetical protein